MRIQPRQHLLEVWRAVMSASMEGDQWRWGGRDKANSISDAEQLLCIMYPATAVPGFRLSSPDGTVDSDVVAALARAGDEVEVTRLLLRCISEYLHTYRDPSGAPVFSGNSYFAPLDAEDQDRPGSALTPDQRALDVVDSYSMSISLSLAAMSFLRDLKRVVTRPQVLADIEESERLACERLTAAMVGLLRSFTVNAFSTESKSGQVLRRNVNQARMADRQLVDRLQSELAPVRASLIRELSIGSGKAVAQELEENPNLLFECGWTWGVLDGAPAEVLGETGTSVGVADDRPYLYFTSVALDGIDDLFSDRTRILGLLDEKQQRLSAALQLRYTLVRQYWSTIAMFGQDKWPVEDIPWTTSDGETSDYFTLLITSIAMQDLVLRRATDADLRRIFRILSDLASRGRITRRATKDDETARRLHSPGVRLKLVGSEKLGPEVAWVVSNFSALLLKRTMRIAELASTTELRNQLLDLAGDIWDHLQDRRLRSGPGGNLWDQIGKVFDIPTEVTQPSWYFTERVVECLVSASDVVTKPPLHSDGLAGYSADLLNEAEHLFDKELLASSSKALGDTLTRVRLRIDRARTIEAERPGSAAALALAVLEDLDKLAAARQRGG
jgi:hypothetical protein